MNLSIGTPKKPIPLRVVFILNLLMCILPFIFYYVFTTKDISIAGLDPIYMVYTGLAYIASFGLLVASILTKKIWLFRGIFLLNILIALPAGAYIGILFAIISIALSFNKKALAYFMSNTPT